MRYRLELEGLVTLDAATIDTICEAPADAGGFLDSCVAQIVEFEEFADLAEADGDAERADFCRQEAAAWRATVRALKRIATEYSRPAQSHLERSPRRAEGAA